MCGGGVGGGGTEEGGEKKERKGLPSERVGARTRKKKLPAR